MTTVNGISAQQLKSVVERIEKLEDEKEEVVNQIKEVLNEAQSNGFDKKTLRTIIKMRKIKLTDLEMQEALLETYKNALGMVVKDV